MKRRIYKKWLKNPLNKRLIWKFCKPVNVVPITPEQQKFWRKDIEDAWNNAYCEAKKDLALKWEDFEMIDDIFIAIRLDFIDEIKNMTNKEFYQKVLDRFNKQKGK